MLPSYRLKKTHRRLIWIIFLVSFLLRIYKLDLLVLNFDEAVYLSKISLIKKIPVQVSDIAITGDTKFPLHVIFIYFLNFLVNDIIFSGRLLSVFYLLFTLYFLCLIMKDELDFNIVLFGISFISFDYMLFQYSRTALIETGQLFFSYFIIYLYLSSLKFDDTLDYLLLGCSISILLLYKINGIFLIFSIFISYIINLNDNIKNYDSLCCFIKQHYKKYIYCVSTGVLMFFTIQWITTGNFFTFFDSIVKTAPAYVAPDFNNINLYFIWFYDNFIIHRNMILFCSICFMEILYAVLYNKYYDKNLEVILIFILVFYFSLPFFTKRPATNYFMRYLIPSIPAIYYFFIKFINRIYLKLKSVYFEIGGFKFSAKLLVICFVAILCFNQILVISTKFNESIYDDYWHIQGFKEVGTLINNITDDSDLILTNTHDRVLSVYSNRTVYKYLWMDENYTMIYSPYQYNIINPFYVISLDDFIGFFEYVVIVDKFPSQYDDDLGHTISPISENFNVTLKQYYYDFLRLSDLVVYKLKPEYQYLNSLDGEILNNPQENIETNNINYELRCFNTSLFLTIDSYYFNDDYSILKFGFNAPIIRFKEYIVYFQSPELFLNDDVSSIKPFMSFSLFYSGAVENKLLLVNLKQNDTLSIRANKIQIFHDAEKIILDDVYIYDILRNPKLIYPDLIVKLSNDSLSYSYGDIMEKNERGSNSSYKLGKNNITIFYDFRASELWSSYVLKVADLSRFDADFITLKIYGDGNHETLGIDFVDNNGGNTRYFKKIDWIGWKNVSFSTQLDKSYPFGVPADFENLSHVNLFINDSGGFCKEKNEIIISEMLYLKLK